MSEFFAQLYSWFGFFPYSADLDTHLRGYDITCSAYIGTPLYLYVGIFMLVSVFVAYILQYHVINSTSFNKKHHWWITALIIVALNFFVAFWLPYHDLQSANVCAQLRISTSDCVGFGISGAVWAFIAFTLLTSFPLPRHYAGANMLETTFWKP